MFLPLEAPGSGLLSPHPGRSCSFVIRTEELELSDLEGMLHISKARASGYFRLVAGTRH